MTRRLLSTSSPKLAETGEDQSAVQRNCEELSHQSMLLGWMPNCTFTLSPGNNNGMASGLLTTSAPSQISSGRTSTANDVP